MSATMLATCPEVESPLAPGLREINDLERRIFAASADIDDAQWQQWGVVNRLLESGVSQRAVARGWINLRTGKPFSHRHVQIVVKVGGYFNFQPRPVFQQVYNKLSNAPTDEFAP